MNEDEVGEPATERLTGLLIGREVDAGEYAAQRRFTLRGRKALEVSLDSR